MKAFSTHRDTNAVNRANINTANISKLEDAQHEDIRVDCLNGVDVESASSAATDFSSTFSNSNPRAMSNANGIAYSLALTPLTNTESSPTGKIGSPRSLKRTYEHMQSGNASPYGAPAEAAPETMTPVQTPPETRVEARPGPEQSKGTKLVFDPALATDKEGKKAKPRYKPFGLGVSLRVSILYT